MTKLEDNTYYWIRTVTKKKDVEEWGVPDKPVISYYQEEYGLFFMVGQNTPLLEYDVDEQLEDEETRVLVIEPVKLKKYRGQE